MYSTVRILVIELRVFWISLSQLSTWTKVVENRGIFIIFYTYI